MTAAELKASILDRAVHGLLVPQDPSDEPAAKSSTVENPPYDLPRGWVWVRLEEICEVLDSQRRPITKSERKQGPYPYYGASCVQDHVAEYIFDEPLVLVGEDGAKWGIGDSTAYYIEGKSWVNNHAHVLRIKPSISPQWVVAFLTGCDLHPFVSGTTVPKLNQAKLRTIPIPLPPLAEQKRIVAKIEELMPLVEEYGKAETELAALNGNFPTALCKSILQHAVEGRLTAAWRKANPRGETAAELLAKIAAEKKHLLASGKIKKQKPLPPITDDEKPFPIPVGWAWVRLDDISYNVGTKENQIPAKAIQPQGRIPVVSQGQKLIDGYCDVPDKQITDIPLVMFGDHTRNVKFIDFKFVIGADGTKFFKPLTDAKWLYYWTLFTSTQIGPRGYGRHWGLLNEQSIPLPPLAEQKAIVERVEELLGLVEKMKE